MDQKCYTTVCDAMVPYGLLTTFPAALANNSHVAIIPTWSSGEYLLLKIYAYDDPQIKSHDDLFIHETVMCEHISDLAPHLVQLKGVFPCYTRYEYPNNLFFVTNRDPSPTHTNWDYLGPQDFTARPSYAIKYPARNLGDILGDFDSLRQHYLRSFMEFFIALIELGKNTGFCHNALHPANIFVDDDNNNKLILHNFACSTVCKPIDIELVNKHKGYFQLFNHYDAFVNYDPNAYVPHGVVSPKVFENEYMGMYVLFDIAAFTWNYLLPPSGVSFENPSDEINNPFAGFWGLGRYTPKTCRQWLQSLPNPFLQMTSLGYIWAAIVIHEIKAIDPSVTDIFENFVIFHPHLVTNVNVTNTLKGQYTQIMVAFMKAWTDMANEFILRNADAQPQEHHGDPGVNAFIDAMQEASNNDDPMGGGKPNSNRNPYQSLIDTKDPRLNPYIGGGKSQVVYEVHTNKKDKRRYVVVNSRRWYLDTHRGKYKYTDKTKTHLRVVKK